MYNMGSSLIILLFPRLFLINYQIVLVVSQADAIECVPGDLNVILGAPHGGYDQPDEIRDRDYGCFIDGQCVWRHDCGQKDEERCAAVTIHDSFTMELAWLIADNLWNVTGRRPTTAINMLHRIKLDANREINEATFAEDLAIEAWEEFHRCINTSKSAIETSEQGMGLFIDLHVHGHENDWAELGYLLSGTDLDDDDIQPNVTSIYHLSTKTNFDFETLLRGNQSFGRFLEMNGYQAVPSPTNSGPDGELYFSGGYNTQIHGSRDGGFIDAIQIESTWRWMDTPPELESYALAISNTILSYLEAHFPQ